MNKLVINVDSKVVWLEVNGEEIDLCVADEGGNLEMRLIKEDKITLEKLGITVNGETWFGLGW